MECGSDANFKGEILDFASVTEAEMEGSMDLIVKNWKRCRCGKVQNNWKTHPGYHPQAQPSDSWCPGCVCSPTLGQGRLDLSLLLQQKVQREKAHQSPNAYSTMRVNLYPPQAIRGNVGGAKTGSRGHVMCEVRFNFQLSTFNLQLATCKITNVTPFTLASLTHRTLSSSQPPYVSHVSHVSRPLMHHHHLPLLSGLRPSTD